MNSLEQYRTGTEVNYINNYNNIKCAFLINGNHTNTGFQHRKKG